MARLLTPALDLLLPHHCLLCEQPVADVQQFCQACFKKFRFVTEPRCQKCGLPFPADVGQGETCWDCEQQPPAFTAARAVWLYDDAARAVILPFKHADRLEFSPRLVKYLFEQVQDWLPQLDMVIPIPLHWWRLWQRGYNQSAIVAMALAKMIGKTYAPEALRRRLATRSQGGLTRPERWANLRGVFTAKASLIQGRRILLVDDVMTTGATLNSGAETLLKQGAKEVYALALARVTKDLL